MGKVTNTWRVDVEVWGTVAIEVTGDTVMNAVKSACGVLREEILPGTIGDSVGSQVIGAKRVKKEIDED